MRFGDAAKFAFPVTVEHDPIDMVLCRRTACVPAVCPRGVESDVACGPHRIVRIEKRLDGAFAEELPGDGLMRALEACAGIFKSAECTNYFAACGYDTT